MQIQRAAWRVLDGKFSPRRQQQEQESVYFSRCGVCLRPVFGGSEVNKTAVEKERNMEGDPAAQVEVASWRYCKQMAL